MAPLAMQGEGSLQEKARAVVLRPAGPKRCKLSSSQWGV